MSSIPNKEYNRRVSNSTEFEIGDMVWGKVKSHPWWPGYILDESIALPSVFENKVDGFILVAFFGDGSYGWLDSSDLIPYASNFLEKSKQSTMKSFVKAVDESVDEFSRRAALGISCRCRNGDNFRNWNIEDYFSVDVAGYEPNGVYDRRQIELARSEFKSKNMIGFLKNLAMNTGEIVNNDMDMDSIRDLARLTAVRRSFFLEKDPTLEEAFGVVSGKQAEEKDETSAKKDEAKKVIASWKKRDQFLKRSSQQHSTLKLKGSSASNSLPKAPSSSQKLPKLLEEKHGPTDESSSEKATKTSNKHKMENVDDKVERKPKKHKNNDDQVEGKSKKHKKETTSSADLPIFLPDLLSLAKDQSYGEERNAAIVVHDLFLKFRNQTYLNIHDKTGAYQELKTHPSSTTLTKFSKPGATASKKLDDSKSSDKTPAYNQESKTHPATVDTAITLKKLLKPTTTTSKKLDGSKSSDKAVAHNQESKTIPEPFSKKLDEVGATEELKTHPKPSSKSTAGVSKKPDEVGATEELKTHPKPSSKPTAAVSKKPDDPKSLDKVVDHSQELKSPPEPSSKRPDEVGASEELKTRPKLFSKPSASISKKPDDSKSLDKVVYDQELKFPLETPSKKPDKAGASDELKTHLKPSSKHGKKALKKPGGSKSSDKPVSHNQESKNPPEPPSKKPDEVGASEEVKTLPKPPSKPTTTNLKTKRADEPKSSEKPVAYIEEGSEEGKRQKIQKLEDATRTSGKRPLPERLIETTIKKAKLAQLKAREKEGAGGVPGKEESRTYLYLKFPRKSPLPSLSNLKVRFAQFKNMMVEGNKVMWNSHACRVLFRYRSDALEALHYAKSNYIFGQFEIECSLKEVEEPKEKEKEKEREREREKEKEVGGSGPRSILKKAGGGNGSDSGKDNQKVQFMLPFEDSSSTADAATMKRDMESGSASFRMQSAVLSEERREPPPVQVSRERTETAVHVREEGRGSGDEEEEEEFKQTFLDLLTRCADIVNQMKATPGYALHHFL